MKIYHDPMFITRLPEFSFIDQAVLIDGEYVGQYSKENIETMRLRYPHAEIMEYAEASPLHDKAMAIKYDVGVVKEVDEERHDYMLNVLPPVGWVHNGKRESSFKLCEKTYGFITLICVALNGKYYEYEGDIRTSHNDVIKYVQDAIDAGKVKHKE